MLELGRALQGGQEFLKAVAIRDPRDTWRLEGDDWAFYEDPLV